MGWPPPFKRESPSSSSFFSRVTTTAPKQIPVRLNSALFPFNRTFFYFLVLSRFALLPPPFWFFALFHWVAAFVVFLSVRDCCPLDTAPSDFAARFCSWPTWSVLFLCSAFKWRRKLSFLFFLKFPWNRVFSLIPPFPCSLASLFSFLPFSSSYYMPPLALYPSPFWATRG